jgi:hypothetical protein
LIKHDVLCRAQSAFRSNYSPQLAVVGVVNLIREAMDGRRLSLLAALDVARAYDSVDHSILLEVLRKLNFDEHEFGVVFGLPVGAYIVSGEVSARALTGGLLPSGFPRVPVCHPSVLVFSSMN